MLVLTRLVGERLVIGDGEIIITVLNVRGNQVRLGIDAPKNVGVHREEVYLRIKGEGKQEISSEDEDPTKKSSPQD